MLFFKFHYVSINSDCDPQGNASYFYFKFHYVSINSDEPPFPLPDAKLTLNSIMFLLIRIQSILDAMEVGTLNSIMFLLILIRSWGSFLFFDFFKFHYVSINSSIYIMDIVTMLTLNSIMFLLIPEGHLNCFNWKAHFKFHYVSINSRKLKPVWRKETEL